MSSPENEPEILVREIPLEMSAGDGRTIEARFVPYNQVAIVSDGGEAYEELFLPGAFNAQMTATHRIKAFLNFRHRQSLQDAFGHVTRIEDRADGLHGELRVLDVPDGDKALKFIDAGVLDRLSIEFVPEKSKVVNGVVHRIKARLLGVALVPEGAYAGAEVLAVREQPILLPRLPGLPDDLAESLAGRGFKLGPEEDTSEQP